MVLKGTDESLKTHDHQSSYDDHNEHHVCVGSLQGTIQTKQENGDPEAQSKPEPPLVLKWATISIDEGLELVHNTKPQEK